MKTNNVQKNMLGAIAVRILRASREDSTILEGRELLDFIQCAKGFQGLQTVGLQMGTDFLTVNFTFPRNREISKFETCNV